MVRSRPSKQWSSSSERMARSAGRGRLENAVAGSVRLVPGARNLAGLHERSIPQRDQLCGPFWGALVLTAAGHPTDQDEVALRAGTTLAEGDPAGWLPPRAPPRRGLRGASRSCPTILWESSPSRDHGPPPRWFRSSSSWLPRRPSV